MKTAQAIYVDVICPMCGANDIDIVYNATGQYQEHALPDVYRCTNPGYGTHDRIVKCRKCHLIYSSPRLSGEIILESYRAVEDQTYIQERDGRRLTFIHHIRHMEGIVGRASGRSLVDVGCYTGVFVEAARAHGWNAVGVEPCRWAAAYAQAHGVPVINSTLRSAGIEDATQDVVTLWDVVEHMPDPLGELRQVARIVRPGGWVVIHTMDIESLAARIMRQHWPWLMKMHLIYFSQRTMAGMLRKAGFEPVYSKAMGRYLRLGYFATRVRALSPLVGRALAFTIDRIGLEKLPIPMNFGDLFTVYAQKS